MIGKNRLNLEIDLPPDLAIESDYTSKTQMDAYLILQVPELWVYDRRLIIYVLENEAYVEVEISPTFPNLPIKMMVEQVMVQAQKIGTSQALRAFDRAFEKSL